MLSRIICRYLRPDMLLQPLRKSRSTYQTLLWLGVDFYLTSVMASVASLVGLRWVLMEWFHSNGLVLTWNLPIRVTLMNYASITFAMLRHPWSGSSRNFQSLLWYFPAFFTSIWLWLYAGSGFLLKAARRFDIGFDWFNRHFDIEKKPLQSIGLVAGALVAFV